MKNKIKTMAVIITKEGDMTTYKKIGDNLEKELRSHINMDIQDELYKNKII